MNQVSCITFLLGRTIKAIWRHRRVVS